MRGQYAAGVVDRQPVVGYREEEGVDPHSETETYVALRLARRELAMGRRPGLRAHRQAPAGPGHRGRARTSTRSRSSPSRARSSRELRPNVLVLRIQPDEGISLHFGAKVPGEAFRVQSVAMDFGYEEAIHDTGMDGYKRLLLRRHDAATRRCSSGPTRSNRPGGSSIPTSRRGRSPAGACTSTRPAPGAPTSPTSCSSDPATPGGSPDL